MPKVRQIKLLLEDGGKVTLDTMDNSILFEPHGGDSTVLNGSGFAMVALNEQIKALVDFAQAEAQASL